MLGRLHEFCRDVASYAGMANTTILHRPWLPSQGLIWHTSDGLIPVSRCSRTIALTISGSFGIVAATTSEETASIIFLALASLRP